MASIMCINLLNWHLEILRSSPIWSLQLKATVSDIGDIQGLSAFEMQCTHTKHCREFIRIDPLLLHALVRNTQKVPKVAQRFLFFKREMKDLCQFITDVDFSAKANQI